MRNAAEIAVPVTAPARPAELFDALHSRWQRTAQRHWQRLAAG